MGEGLTDLKKELELEKSSKADLNKELDECKAKCANFEKELFDYKSQVNKYYDLFPDFYKAFRCKADQIWLGTSVLVHHRNNLFIRHFWFCVCINFLICQNTYES